MRFVSILSFLSILASTAYGNAIDSIANAGAEANAIAGAGTSYIGGAFGSVNNPAGLARIKKYNAELSTSYNFFAKRAPANGIGTELTSSTFAPSFTVGGGYRFNEYLTVGLSIDTPGVGGSRFSGVNFGIPTLTARDMDMFLVFMEISPTIAINLPHNIDIGISYRIDYVKESLKLYDTSNILSTGLAPYDSGSLSGWGFSGFKIGVQYRPVDRLSLGIVYRNPIKIKTSGIATATVFDAATGAQVGDPSSVAVSSVCKFADRFMLGAAYQIFKDVWTLAFDYEYNLYSNYSSVVINTPDASIAMPLGYKNRHVVRLGSDYRITPVIPVRVGFAYFTTYENADHFNALNIGAPAPSWMFTLGTGYSWSDRWMLNFAYILMRNSGSISNPAPATADASTVPGNYMMMINSFVIDLLFNI